jgi:hypothetical protein
MRLRNFFRHFNVYYNMAKKNTEIKKPPILFLQTQAIIKDLEQALGGDVFTYWISDNGSISPSDVVAIYELLKQQNKKWHNKPTPIMTSAITTIMRF